MRVTLSRNIPIEYYEYYDWVNSREFESPKEHRKYISREDEGFVRTSIYPLFINQWVYSRFKSIIPLPLVLKEEHAKRPKFVVNNDLFTLLFYRSKNSFGKGWVVSFHIKEHGFCDERIEQFREWMKRNYGDILLREMYFKGMPQGFYHPQLKLAPLEENPENNNVVFPAKEQDFCIEFFDDASDTMLFNFCKSMKLFIQDYEAI